jgi:hypothetical protein
MDSRCSLLTSSFTEARCAISGRGMKGRRFGGPSTGERLIHAILCMRYVAQRGPRLYEGETQRAFVNVGVSPNPSDYTRSNRLRLGFGLRSLPRRDRAAPCGIGSSGRHFRAFTSAARARGRMRERICSSYEAVIECRQGWRPTVDRCSTGIVRPAVLARLPLLLVDPQLPAALRCLTKPSQGLTPVQCRERVGVDRQH